MSDRFNAPSNTKDFASEAVQIIPARFRRPYAIFTNVVCAAALFYVVLEADFPGGDHVFTPLRKVYQAQKDKIFAISPGDLKKAAEENKAKETGERK